MTDMTNMVALLTAAGSGMGRATALRLARAGATVVVTDLDEAAAKETARMVGDAGGAAEALALNVADLEQLRAVFEHVDSTYGELHVLHNHAGIPGPAGLEVSVEDWTRTVDINMRSAFYGTAWAIPLMEKAGRGSIVFTSSVAGVTGSPLSPLYSMTKAGITVFAKSVALLHAPTIRANVIAPGPVDTPMLPTFLGRRSMDEAEEGLRNFIEGSVPMKRRCSPEEIAEAVYYLASDASSFVTGVVLPVDGGYLAR